MTTSKITKRRRPQPTQRRTAPSLLRWGVLLSSVTPSFPLEDCNYCEGKSTGFIQVPGTECSEFVQCNNGQIVQTFNCSPGLIYDTSINQCNWATMVTCGPDYVCPTHEPTGSPANEPTPIPTFYPPTLSPERGAGSAPRPRPPPGSPVVTNPASSSTQEGAATSSAQEPLAPYRQEHHAAVFAHLNANKIGISNNIFSRARKVHKISSGAKVDSDAFRHYSYLDFSRALRTMVDVGYVVPMTDENGNDISYRNTFYLGDATNVNGAAVGLVNVAVFLSQALADSLSTGSCDEVNTDMYNGYLPASNSCGQWGLSYQDMHCDLSEATMECPLDYGMQISAGPNAQGVTPFFCGSTDMYPFTGVANYGNVIQSADSPVQNREGRTDVENCCWWGRGAVQTRGVCQYGKLNYYLGARAFEEGRPAIFPDINFCATPQKICSTDPKSGDVEWIASLFRWIDTVQSYDDPEWSYVQQLNQFVMGGMVDGFFIQAVSGITTQGCHSPPCAGDMGTAVEMADAGERWSNFQQVAQTLGLPVKDVQR
ncbi:hypothetical protein HJC23_000549 [Cyclotella cryptica]|uniref:Chitin-binding type-2 domain-containing protein n=1 Tax=Cyclotella cryptica TaxID=29204 RepID=A0ABD3PU66_9STRA|eukprot:CCRYP_011724-RA/>CCRYP_011724-RA protein AED:0.13 eAED:0.13 QI:0/-1/0/1/-1/1/1/0/539